MKHIKNKELGRMSLFEVSQTVKEPSPSEGGLETIFSSRGTRWSGLLVEKKRRTFADCPHVVEIHEPWIVDPAKVELKWMARGTRYRFTIRPGMSMFINEGYRFDELTGATPECEVVYVRLEQAKIVELLHGDAPSSKIDFFDNVTTHDEQAVGMITAMYAEARAGSPAGALFSESISVALLTHLYDRYDRAGAARRLEGRLSPRQVETINRYVTEHIGSDLSVVELAGVLQLSPAHFCRMFPKTCGVTPHRFVLNKRIAIAIDKLESPSAPPLAELARALGFGDQAHFSNIFRTLVGCPPSEFRNRNN
jgi:AraC family transcriptional regulator